MAGTFTGDKSMSVNYALGVDRYYAETGEDYRNPHYAGIQQATACIMGSWWPLLLGMRSQSQPQGTMPLGGSPMATPPPPATASHCSDVAAAPPQLLGSVHVLDLAAGSGEATQALQAWWSAPPAITGGSGSRSGTRRPTAAITPPIRALSGAEPSSSLPPPSLPSPLSSGLQLCVDAADPYTHRAYAKQVGRPAELFTFQDVADGCLSERAYHLCICSYALHVLDESRLFSTLMGLSLVSAHLVVLSPHKKPTIGVQHGWALVASQVVERVHVWLYESLNLQKQCELEGAVDGSTQLDWERSYGSTQLDWERSYGPVQQDMEGEAEAVEGEDVAEAEQQQGSGAGEISDLLAPGTKLD